MSNDEKPESPWVLILLGALLGFVGSLFLVDDQAPRWIPLILLWVGGVLTSVGVVGAGVTMGMVRADWLIRVKPRR